MGGFSPPARASASEQLGEVGHGPGEMLPETWHGGSPSRTRRRRVATVATARPPRGLGPHGLLRVEQAPVAGPDLLGEHGGRAVLDDAATLDDEHALERAGLAHVVRDAEQRGAPPSGARFLQQRLPALAVQPAKGLVEDHEARVGPQQRPREANALTLAARRSARRPRRAGTAAPAAAAPAPAPARPARSPSASGVAGGHGVAIAEIVEERAVPELHRRIDPGGLAPQLGQAAAVERLAVHEDAARGGAVPAEESPTKLDLPAPDNPTIATCSPGAIATSSESRMVCPVARTVTCSTRRPTPAAVPASSFPCSSATKSAALSVGAPSGSRMPHDDVARRRVLAELPGEVLAQHGERQRPVGQQEDSRGLSAARDVAHHQPRHQPDGCEGLRGLEREAHPQEREPRRAPTRPAAPRARAGGPAPRRACAQAPDRAARRDTRGSARRRGCAGRAPAPPRWAGRPAGIASATAPASSAGSALAGSIQATPATVSTSCVVVRAIRLPSSGRPRCTCRLCARCAMSEARRLWKYRSARRGSFRSSASRSRISSRRPRRITPPTTATSTTSSAAEKTRARPPRSAAARRARARAPARRSSGTAAPP